MSQTPSLHIRRCHVCGFVCESEAEILKCYCCKKSLLPFFYFDKKKVTEYAEDKTRPEEYIDPKGPGYRPIRGLTAYW